MTQAHANKSSMWSPPPLAARVLPALLLGAGVSLVGLAVHAAMRPVTLPFAMTRSTASPEELTGITTAAAPNSGEIEKLEFRVPDVRDPIARVLVAKDSQGRMVPLDWRNNVTEPVLAADVTSQEIEKVTKAIRDHVAEDAVVLGWWDLSRKIRLLSQRAAPLDDPQSRGLLIPAAWAANADPIRLEQRALWGAAVPAAEADRFTRFIDALLLDEAKGAAALADLAPGKTVYVAVHLSDIWKVTSSRPEAISLAYRDFPGSGVSHGVMKAAREWMSAQKLDAPFAIEPLGNAVRLHYLPANADQNRLIAKLLPFTTSNPMRLSRLKLVYQHRGFWIYKLAADEKPVSG